MTEIESCLIKPGAEENAKVPYPKTQQKYFFIYILSQESYRVTIH